jgi:hypothetical protein
MFMVVLELICICEDSFVYYGNIQCWQGAFMCLRRVRAMWSKYWFLIELAMCKFIASSWVMHVFKEAGVSNIHILGMALVCLCIWAMVYCSCVCVYYCSCMRIHTWGLLRGMFILVHEYYSMFWCVELALNRKCLRPCKTTQIQTIMSSERINLTSDKYNAIPKSWLTPGPHMQPTFIRSPPPKNMAYQCSWGDPGMHTVHPSFCY